ncbi:DNA cross-link repair protein PSO2/SNM1 [Savitreella phatthalungensis]
MAPQAKKQRTLLESLGRPNASTSAAFAHAVKKSPQSRTGVTSSASRAQAASTQTPAPGGAGTTNLLDFYPNLRGDAPLFRAEYGNSAHAHGGSKRKLLDSARDPYDSLKQPDGSASPCLSLSPGNSHCPGPFVFDEDHETEEIDADQTAVPISNESADFERRFGNTFDAGEENSSMREERDMLDLHDSGTLGSLHKALDDEDETWSWQEYNAETFGCSPMHGDHETELQEQPVSCPICGAVLNALEVAKRATHVNACLDMPEAKTQPDTSAEPDSCAVRITGPAIEPDTIIKSEADQSVLAQKSPTGAVLSRSNRDPSLDMDLDFNDAFPPLMKSDSSNAWTLQPDADRVKDAEDFEIVEDIDEKPQIETPTVPSAFSKIMVGHAEEKQWATAARTELAQRGTRYRDRVCPFYKIMSPLPLAVDAFKYGRVPGISGYILTHFHSDHYGGLSATWDAGPIYCSSITGSLCIQQLKVKPEFIVKLPMDTPVDVQGVTVTLIDANHCPGSAIFVLEAYFKGRQLRYLHCGDFRATPEQLMHPSLREKRIDCIYLDTTYLSPKYAFPTQNEVIEACSYVCRDLAGLMTEGRNPVAEARDKAGVSRFFTKRDDATGENTEMISKTDQRVALTCDGPATRRLLVVVGTYSIGKERIVLGIAKALNSKIFATGRKREIIQCLEDDELSNRLTDDPHAAQVHMTYLQEIRPETLQDYLTTMHPHFGRVVGFRGTGWTYSPPKDRFLDNPSVETILSWRPRYDFRRMTPARGSTAKAACYGVPYSEHSSFRELMCFLLAADVQRVIPTVNVGSAKSRERMKAWCTKWEIERRKNGRLALREGQTEWD